MDINCFSQTIYQTVHEIKFNLSQDKEYTAFVVLQSDGNSQIRISRIDSVAKIIYSLPLIFSKASFLNIADTLKPIIISGSDSPVCPKIYFNCFNRMHFDAGKKINQISVYENGQLVPVTINSFKYLRPEKLAPNYVLQFFDSSENFYKNCFSLNQDRNKKIKPTPWMYFFMIANTADKTIGKGCERDYSNMKKIIHDIAFQMDMPVVDIDIIGKNISKQNVLNSIKNLNPERQDIVFFYYTGHGFSYQSDSLHKFPQLDLRNYPPSDKINVINNSTKNIAEIFEMIKQKKARLNFVLSDCCNSTIAFQRPKRGKFPIPTRTGEITKPINKTVLANLFLNPNISILASAADKGEFAISDITIGSIYTYNFVNYLISGIWGADNNITWQKILKATQTKTLKMSVGYDIGGGKPGFQKAISNIIH